MDDAVFFREATTQICGSLDPNAVLQRCFDFLTNFMPLESIAMTVYEPETESLHNVAYVRHSIYQDLVPQEFWETPIQISIQSWKRLMSMAGTCTVVNDAYADVFGGRKICEAMGFDKLCYIVLRVDIGRDYPGHIVIGSGGTGLYSQEHARLLELIRDPFSIAMTNAIRYQEVVRLKDLLHEDNNRLFSKLRKSAEDTIVGKERGLKDVMQTVMRVAELQSPVLLLGETGVGKEVIANAIHYNSQQAGGPFVKINCGAIPDSLIDSELFGHEKGAFTGAVGCKRGHFERAHNGTLFLDEIGDLPLSAQTRLLRVLQQKELLRVGGTQPIKVNARIISATHNNLKDMVKNGEFREDLWFRINVMPITIPPLRQRKEDIPELVKYFISRKAQEMNLRHYPKVSPHATERLKTYDWPGNVRELENYVERALIQNAVGRQDTILNFEDIGEAAPKSKVKPTLVKSNFSISHDEVTRQHFQEVLKLTKGKIQGTNGAAAMLGMHPNTLRHRLRKLGISFGRHIPDVIE